MPRFSQLIDPTEFRAKLGDRIRQVRTAAGINQEVLATSIDSSQSAITRIECGQADCTVTRLHQIAQALNTNISTLLEGLL